MGEVKRRTRASTVEHRRIAACIDARIKELDALGLGVDILAEMHEYIPDFSDLAANVFGYEMEELYVEFSGFYQFAKTVKALSSASKIKLQTIRL